MHEEQGWGRRDETRRTSDDLAAYGLGWEWFTLGDLDLATHLARTELLRAGLPLSEVTRRLCERWQPGVRLLPATDDEVETHVATADGHLAAAGHPREVLTPALLRQVYGVEADILEHPRTGRPVIAFHEPTRSE